MRSWLGRRRWLGGGRSKELSAITQIGRDNWQLSAIHEIPLRNQQQNTFTIMHQAMNPGFASSVPYNVAQIDLTEGVRVTSNITGAGNDALRVGMALEVVFEDTGDGVSIPKFRPAR